ncbi:MAG: hypothetical protein M3Y71_19825 [Actinomycetota bacterium]|nr:hypothetical protein [Actinomycetota bacterium]
MIATLLPSAASTSSGFNWGGLVVLIVVAAAVWPLWRRVRANLSRQRRERWAREEGWDERAGFARESDPNLSRGGPPADPPTEPPTEPPTGPADRPTGR